MSSAIANAKGSCMVPILLCKLHLEALVSSINVLITQPFSTAWTTYVGQHSSCNKAWQPVQQPCLLGDMQFNIK